MSRRHRELEEVLCREVAKASAAFEMQSSKWNRGVGAGRAVFEVDVPRTRRHLSI